MNNVLLRTVRCPHLAALLLAVAVAAPPAAAEPEPAARQPWPLACRLTNYGNYQQAAWEHLRSLGIRNVFLFLPPPDQVEATIERLQAYGLAPLVMRGVLDLATAGGVQRSEPQFAALRRMGCRYMFVSPKHPGVGKEETYARLHRAGELARRYGVTIVLETHPDLGTNAAAHLETMRGVGHPNVRVNFDTGNIHFYNPGADAVAELEKIFPYVATVEIKDHNGRPQDWHFPALGRGVVNIPGVLEVLRRRGFQGPVTMEIEGIQGQPWNEPQTLQVIAESTAYLRSLAPFR